MRKKKSFNELINLYNKKHNYKYDYSNSVYNGINLNICIICPIHGEFHQTADSHKLYGCPKCGKNKQKEYYTKCSKKHTINEIEKYIKHIGEQYQINFNEIEEYNSIDLITILCKRHNTCNTFQVRKVLNRKSFCNECRSSNRSNISSKPHKNQRITFIDFIHKADVIFPKGFYSFERVYNNKDFLISEELIKVICHRHNLVLMRKAINIINNKCACFTCNKSISGPERIIWKELDELGIKFEFQKVFNGLKIGWKKYLKVDFYIPKFNLVIEYDGEQHFKPLKRGLKLKDDEALERFNILKKNDMIKNQYCIDNLINIERISYQQKNINQIIKTIIHKYEK